MYFLLSNFRSVLSPEDVLIEPDSHSMLLSGRWTPLEVLSPGDTLWLCMPYWFPVVHGVNEEKRFNEQPKSHPRYVRSQRML